MSSTLKLSNKDRNKNKLVTKLKKLISSTSTSNSSSNSNNNNNNSNSNNNNSNSNNTTNTSNYTNKINAINTNVIPITTNTNNVTVTNIIKKYESKSNSKPYIPSSLQSKQSTSPSIDRSSTSISNNKPKEVNQSNSTKLTKLQSKMVTKLSGSQFRWLNEKLYTISSAESYKLYQKEPILFKNYHDGYKKQVQNWPSNPIDHMIEYCQLRILENKSTSLLNIGDFGCGEAGLAKIIDNTANTYSYDLVKCNKYITVCDIAKTPLENETLDIAIFCLSLMGTNFKDFLKEAFRTLKPHGILKIAEVQSRFESITEFVELVEQIGFRKTEQIAPNNVFILFTFKKLVSPPVTNLKKRPASESISADSTVLKPCKYKKR